MDDLSLLSRSRKNRRSPLIRLQGEATYGTFVGGFLGASISTLAGAILGYLNEMNAQSEAYDELHVGFGEYSMVGLMMFGGFMGGILAVCGSPIGLTISSRLHRRWLGAISGVLAVFSIYLLIFVRGRPEMLGSRQEDFVFLVGGICGTVLAVIFVNRHETPRRSHDGSPQIGRASCRERV